mgnify:CR=1 FL=1
MFQALFATMNEVLEEIRKQYPMASMHQKGELLEQLEGLKIMSDICIEEWLQFEEHMGVVHRQIQEAMEHEMLFMEQGWLTDDELMTHEMAEQFERGQGYYELSMFDHAIKVFEDLCSRHPDFAPARFYLALCNFHEGHFLEASRHFGQIVASAEQDKRILAISYHALACIHLIWNQEKKAEQYFQLAMITDPSLNFYSLS